MKNYQKIIILAFLIIGMVAVSACVGSGPAETPLTTPSAPSVEMINASVSYKSYGDAYCYGILKSNINKPLTASVTFAIYDKNDVVKLGDGFDIVKLDPLGQSKFEAIAFGSNDYPKEDTIEEKEKLEERLNKIRVSMGESPVHNWTYRCYVDRVQ